MAVSGCAQSDRAARDTGQGDEARHTHTHTHTHTHRGGHSPHGVCSHSTRRTEGLSRNVSTPLGSKSCVLLQAPAKSPSVSGDEGRGSAGGSAGGAVAVGSPLIAAVTGSE
jgi:hypothetical protein